MEDITFVYKCGECDANGVIYLKDTDEDDVATGMFCPACGSKIEFGDYEVNGLIGEDVVSQLKESTEDFIHLIE